MSNIPYYLYRLHRTLQGLGYKDSFKLYDISHKKYVEVHMCYENPVKYWPTLKGDIVIIPGEDHAFSGRNRFMFWYGQDSAPAKDQKRSVLERAGNLDSYNDGEDVSILFQIDGSDARAIVPRYAAIGFLSQVSHSRVVRKSEIDNHLPVHHFELYSDVHPEQEFEDGLAISPDRKDELFGMKYIDAMNVCRSYAEKELVIAEALLKENEDRKTFVTGAHNFDPYRSLLSVFSEDTNRSIFKQNRCSFPEERAAPRMFVGKNTGVLPTELTLDTFKLNFEKAYGNDLLQYIDWTNVVAAGGSVSGCLQPVPHTRRASIESRRHYFNNVYLPNSDIDLYIYGLDADAASQKLKQIYDAICRACPHEVICIRTVNAVTMISQYPYRHVQIILRLYSSPYEILAGFDVDSCCVLYDGKQVWMTPRSHSAFLSGANRIDLTRRSPTYETRLAKYAERGFEVLLPLDPPDLFAGDWRSRIDPTLRLRYMSQLDGLAKLLRLENCFGNAGARLREYQHSTYSSSAIGRLSTKSVVRMEKITEFLNDSKISDYTVVFLPWGPCYTARSTVRHLIKRNEGVNAIRGTPNLHTFFWGTAEKILTDCAPNDFYYKIPGSPRPGAEKHVHGPLTWMRYNPGQQMIGSFHPLTADDWAESVFICPNLISFCTSLNLDDSETIQRVKKFPTTLNKLRVVHAAMYAGAYNCVKALIDMGAEIRPEASGQNILHIATILECPEIAEYVFKKVNNAKQLLKQDWNMNGDYSLSPVQLALRIGNPQVLGIFLNEVTEPEGICLPNSESPLLFIRRKTEHKIGEVADLLLQKAKEMGMETFDKFIIYSNHNVFTKAIKAQNQPLVRYLFQTPLISDTLRKRALKHQEDNRRALDVAIEMCDIESMNLIYSVIPQLQISIGFDPVRHTLVKLMTMIGKRLGVIIPTRDEALDRALETLDIYTLDYPAEVNEEDVMGLDIEKYNPDEETVMNILEWLLDRGFCMIQNNPPDAEWRNLENIVNRASIPTCRKRQRMVNGVRTFIDAFELAKTAAVRGESLQKFKECLQGMNKYKEDICGICRALLQNDEPVTELRNCSHFFHVRCFNRMKMNGRNNCPICMTPFGAVQDTVPDSDSGEEGNESESD